MQALEVSGKVLDIGGSRKSGYHSLLRGGFSMQVANMDDEQGTDLKFDLEEKFPIEENSYDTVLCINVLEHIFNYQNVLSETHRILKPGGEMVVAVPFLIQVHPSPRDHWRYTEYTLNRIFTDAGFSRVEVESIGTGVFGAGYSMMHNLYRYAVVQVPLKTLSRLADGVLTKLFPNSFYTKRYYTLGYFVRATK